MYVVLGTVIVLGMWNTVAGSLLQFGGEYNYREGVSRLVPQHLRASSPTPELMAEAPLGFQLHALLAFVLFALWPFTRLVHVFSRAGRLPHPALHRLPLARRAAGQPGRPARLGAPRLSRGQTNRLGRCLDRSVAPGFGSPSLGRRGTYGDEVAGEADLRRAFEALAHEVVEPLRRFLARRTDPATAEDVLADTLLVCWRRLDEVPATPLPWVYVVARHCLANAERGTAPALRVAGQVATLDPPAGRPPDAGPPDAGPARGARRAPPAGRRAAAAVGLGAADPGRDRVVLEVTPNAVSIRLHRARRRLRAELGKNDAGRRT